MARTSPRTGLNHQKTATLANVDTDIEVAVEPDIARNVPISRGDLQGSQATPYTELSEWRKVCKMSIGQHSEP